MVVINPLGHSYFFDGDKPEFSFFWTRYILHYDEWLRTMRFLVSWTPFLNDHCNIPF